MMKKTTRTEKSAEGTPTPPSPTSMEKPAKGTPEPTPPSPRWDRMTQEFGEAMREYTLSKRVRAGGGTLKKENDESYQFRSVYGGPGARLPVLARNMERRAKL